MSRETQGAGVLVVDDEPDMRVLVGAVIDAANRGLRVVGQAGSGEEAIERWREIRPDVILLDHRMPGMSGLEAAEHILAEEPEQWIILFSAYLDASTIARAEELGIREWLGKDDVSAIPEALWRYPGP